MTTSAKELADATALNAKGRLPDDPLETGELMRSETEQQIAVAAEQASLTQDEDALCVQYPLTDIGNGKRLVTRHRWRLRYCGAWRKWLVYDGRHWQTDTGQAAEAFAKETALAIDREVLILPEGKKAAQRKHATGSSSAKSVANMLAMARSEPGVPLQPVELDSDPLLLNVNNGTIDLRTGDLLKHQPGDLLTKLAPVDFDPQARCPEWEAFVQRIMRGDETLKGFLRRAAGYALTGDVGADAFFFLQGGGANGKTTFLNTLARMMGDYAAALPAEVLLEARGERHSTDKTLLHGARLAICQEVKEGRRFDMAAVKALTGRDLITARRMREDNWTWAPTHKLFLAANSKPRVPESDEAAWRRILLVPFDETIPEAERDPRLEERLAKELPGILAWAVRGCSEWLQDGAGRKGLAAPERVREATANYREEEDLVGGFLEARCVLGGSYQVQQPVLYKSFCGWCDETKDEPLRKRDFNARIQQRFGDAKKGNGARQWHGVTLRTAPVQGEMPGVARA
jgi:putative DNA primase/helicase